MRYWFSAILFVSVFAVVLDAFSLSHVLHLHDQADDLAEVIRLVEPLR